MPSASAGHRREPSSEATTSLDAENHGGYDTRMTSITSDSTGTLFECVRCHPCRVSVLLSSEIQLRTSRGVSRGMTSQREAGDHEVVRHAGLNHLRRHERHVTVENDLEWLTVDLGVVSVLLAASKVSKNTVP